MLVEEMRGMAREEPNIRSSEKRKGGCERRSQLVFDLNGEELVCFLDESDEEC